ncbi:MAG: acyltransferase [Acidobacteriia bacterium]|nr:acyltransferase [Terriglobia bacterium]
MPFDRPGRRHPLAWAPQLDGLRAVAVAAVAWSHWAPQRQFGLPWASGVDLFFVLSGFLITDILLRLRDAPDVGRALRAFYIRRALRILPAFYLTLALTAWFNVPGVRATWPWHAAYLSNVTLFFHKSGVSHFWSLAVEEQFYFVWPWIILLVPRQWLARVCVGAVLLSPLVRVLTLGFGWSGLLIALPTGHFDSLGIGALLSVEASGFTPAWPPHTVRRLCTRVGVPLWLAGVALTVSGGSLPPVVWDTVFPFAQALTYAAIVSRAAAGFRGIVGRVLEARLMTGVGRISYGVYLVHLFVPGIVRTLLSAIGVATLSLRAWELQPLHALVTIGLGALSWQLMEGPINGLKRRFPYFPARNLELRPAIAASPRPQ